MTEIDIKKPLKTIKEWRAEVFPERNSYVANSDLKNDPVKLAELLADKAVANLRK